jgi:predicted nucleotidyltransferase
MIRLIKDNMVAIRDACRKYHVRSLYLVGSAAKDGVFTDQSDVDFLYRFKKEEIVEMEYADNYFDFLFYLQELLNRKVDLVAEEKMWNPYFIKNKQLIYES